MLKGLAGKITVHRAPSAPARGMLQAGSLLVPAALGAAGLRTNKREGDHATPRGKFRLLQVRYRPDRVPRPITALPVRRIEPQDGWCDAPGDRNYNRGVRLPYPASHERMWRDDHLYDLLVVLDHNQMPRVPNRGSAIFLHLARDGFLPTEGCIALRKDDMVKLLAAIAPDASIEIN